MGLLFDDKASSKGRWLPWRRATSVPLGEELLDLFKPGNTTSTIEVDQFFDYAFSRKAAKDTSTAHVAHECLVQFPSLARRSPSDIPSLVDRLLTRFGDDALGKRKFIQDFFALGKFLKFDGLTLVDLGDVLFRHIQDAGTANDVFHVVLAKWIPQCIDAKDTSATNRLFTLLKNTCGDDRDMNSAYIRTGFASFSELLDVSPHGAQALVKSLFRASGKHHLCKIEYLEASFDSLTYVLDAEKRALNEVARSVASETAATILECAFFIQRNSADFEGILRAYTRKDSSVTKAQAEAAQYRKRELEDVFVRKLLLIVGRSLSDNRAFAHSLLESLDRMCFQTELRLTGDRGRGAAIADGIMDIFPKALKSDGAVASDLYHRMLDGAKLARNSFDNMAFKADDGTDFFISPPSSDAQPTLFVLSDVRHRDRPAYISLAEEAVRGTLRTNPTAEKRSAGETFDSTDSHARLTAEASHAAAGRSRQQPLECIFGEFRGSSLELVERAEAREEAEARLTGVVEDRRESSYLAMAIEIGRSRLSLGASLPVWSDSIGKLVAEKQGLDAKLG